VFSFRYRFRSRPVSVYANKTVVICNVNRVVLFNAVAPARDAAAPEWHRID